MKLAGERASSFFGDELILGSFLVRNLPIFIAISFYLKKNNYLILFFLICYGVAIFFAGSRTSFFMYLLFIFFITFYIFKNKLHIFIFYLFLFTTTIFGFFNTSQGHRIFFNTVSQISQNQSNALKIFSIRHQAHYETALNIFKDNLIFGSGPNLFRYICHENKYYPKKTLKFKYTYLPPEPKVHLYVFDKRYNKKIKIDNSIFLKEGLNKIKLKIENIYKILEINNNKKNYEIEIKINSKQNKSLQASYILGPDDEILISKKYNENDIIINNLSKNYAYTDGCNTHPHNFHIQILSEIGIIGYLFLLFFLLRLIIIYFKNLKFKENIKNFKVQNILIIGILINFFPFMPSGSFFNNWMSFVIFFPIGFFIYFRYLDNNG